MAGEKNFEKRKMEALFIKNKYPDKVPVICEKYKGSHLGELEKKKFIVPKDMYTYQFNFLIRKRLRMSDSASGCLYFFVGGKHILKSDKNMEEAYDKYKSPDGFLYIFFSEENTLG